MVLFWKVWPGLSYQIHIAIIVSHIQHYFELYLFRFGYGLSYNKDFEKPGVNTCFGAETCGCSSNDWGYDCNPSYGSCDKGCDFANETKHLFFHGPDVFIDPTATTITTPATPTTSTITTTATYGGGNLIFNFLFFMKLNTVYRKKHCAHSLHWI